MPFDALLDVAFEDAQLLFIRRVVRNGIEDHPQVAVSEGFVSEFVQSRQQSQIALPLCLLNCPVDVI